MNVSIIMERSVLLKAKTLLAKGVTVSVVLLFFSVSGLAFAGHTFSYPLEDIQKIVFFVLLVFLFLFSRVFLRAIPASLFFVAFLGWLFLSFRTDVMRELGFFSGRVVIGKFDEDVHGLEGRELYQELRKIAVTYSLPGPVVLPVKESSFRMSGASMRNLSVELKEDRWRSVLHAPSMFIFANESKYQVYFPHFSMTSDGVSDGFKGMSDEDIKRAKFYNYETGAIHIKGYEKPFLLPYIPQSLSFPKTPPKVMYHYLAWLSAFFHQEIRKDPIAAVDVINEAARIRGPWKSQIPRVFARYLFTLQEFVLWGGDLSDYEVDTLRARLARALQGLVAFPDQELTVQILTLDALCLLSKVGDQDAYNQALEQLYKIISDEKIPYAHKYAALYNVGVLLDQQ